MFRGEWVSHTCGSKLVSLNITQIHPLDSTDKHNYLTPNKQVRVGLKFKLVYSLSCSMEWIVCLIRPGFSSYQTH